MPKPPLREPYCTLCHEIVETLIAGHKRYRPDLDYPESYSDMQGAVEGLLQMFEVKRRPIAIPLSELQAVHCSICGETIPKEGICNICRLTATKPGK